MRFTDRNQAGAMLGARLVDSVGTDAVVLGLPRGGAPVGYQVARTIGAPFDVIVVRKLGVPFQPELAMGAIGEDGVLVLDQEVVSAARVRPPEIAAVEARERAELDRRVGRYRSVGPRIPLGGRIGVVVDDGMATGSTARAACLVARAHGATWVIVAVPVASHQAATTLGLVADRVIALEQPDPFLAVGRWYRRFDQVSDDQVVALLAGVQPTGVPPSIAHDPGAGEPGGASV